MLEEILRRGISGLEIGNKEDGQSWPKWPNTAVFEEHSGDNLQRTERDGHAGICVRTHNHN